MRLLCFKFLLLIYLTMSSLAKVTPNWWTKQAGIEIENESLLHDLIIGEGKTKFIVIDFYWERCPDCENILEVWNNIVHDSYSKFNGEVILTQVEGKRNFETISQNYGIKNYPTLVMLAPLTYGTQYQWYPRTLPETQDSIERWIQSYIKKYKRENPEIFEQQPKVEEEKEKEDKEHDIKITTFKQKPQYEQPYKSSFNFLPTQNLAFIDRYVKANIKVASDLNFVMTETENFELNMM